MRDESSNSSRKTQYLKIENYREEEMLLIKMMQNEVQVVTCIWLKYSQEHWEASWTNTVSVSLLKDRRHPQETKNQLENLRKVPKHTQNPS